MPRLNKKRIYLSTLFMAVAISLSGVVTWVATGMHTGWTKTKVQTMQTDEITGIEYPVWEDSFVAGIEFLGATFIIATLLLAIALLIKRKNNHYQAI